MIWHMFKKEDLDKLFQDIGNLDDGVVITQDKGVIMNIKTFKKIVDTRKMNVEHGKRYQIYLTIEERVPKEILWK